MPFAPNTRQEGSQRIIRRLLFVTLGLAVAAAHSARAQEDGAVDQPLVVTVPLQNEPITPIAARYLHRAIDQAQRERAQCVVILLDTPGGLVESTRDIVKDILSSNICVVVYVTPQGSRAASAGGFILLAAHVAAMSPATRVGAMHPVQIGGLPISPPETPEEQEDAPDDQRSAPQKPATPIQQKTVNDTVAWARSLAELRSRNTEWTQRAVRESIVATEKEALQEGIIDLVASDLDELLTQLDGREVQLRERQVTLQTASARTHTIEMWWGDRILATLASPNIAFLLLIFGFYGLLFELYSPGWGVAGTLGAICLVLAFMGLAILPINYVGLTLIVLGLSLLVAEAIVTSFGVLAAGGIVCLATGGLMLVDSPEGFLRVSLTVIVPVVAATAVITLLLVGGIVRTYRGQVQTGSEGLIGQPAVAAEQFMPQEDHFVGSVHIQGERWPGISSDPLSSGQSVTVRQRDGLTLFVDVSDSKDS